MLDKIQLHIQKLIFVIKTKKSITWQQTIQFIIIFPWTEYPIIACGNLSISTLKLIWCDRVSINILPEFVKVRIKSDKEWRVLNARGCTICLYQSNFYIAIHSHLMIFNTHIYIPSWTLTMFWWFRDVRILISLRNLFRSVSSHIFVFLMYLMATCLKKEILDIDQILLYNI